ncbi:MAG: PAS domain S-box protein [Proteobacteria bacterium]|nr:PAS domain S-box protein [Pseudomonadota bacterium]
MKILAEQFPWRTFYRIAFVQAMLVVVSIGSSGLAARYFFKRSFVNQVQSQLQDTLKTISSNFPNQLSESWCEQSQQGTQFKLSLLKSDGTTICGEKDEVNRAHDELVIVTLSVPQRDLVIKASQRLDNFGAVVRLYNTSFGIYLLGLATLLCAVAFWYARKLVFPLGRLLVKTQNLVARHPRVLTQDDLEEEAFGEWCDLESNIDDLGKNLESTVLSLTTEQVELDAIMGAISDAILAVDQDEVPIFYNSRFEMIFGGGKVRRNAKLWEILRDPEILKAYKKALSEGLSGGTRAFSLETESQPRRYFSLSVSPLRRQGGSIYGALGIFHDVTELKAAEQMRIDFVANVSHELRTPLTAIKGYTETLMLDLDQNKGGQSEREFLSIIARNAERLMNLMGDLLELSALESSLLLHKEIMSTREITERVLKQLQSRFKNKHQATELKVEALSVNADPNRVEQVLINLLDNASKYSPEGGKITVSWELDRKGGKDCFLKVQDSGPGIPVEHLGRLFERFYRVDKARSREQGGTGLGLAIVKHIMQRHEGAVWVESSPGQGSLFTCRFPG